MTAKGWSWKLIVLPVIAVTTLVVVTLYGAGVLDVTDLGSGIRIFDVVLVGLAVFLFFLIIELLLLWRTFVAEQEDEAAATETEEAPAEDEWPEEEPEAFDEPEPVAAEAGPEFDIFTTADHYDGRQVLEMARPPKSSVAGGIYASTYVHVNGQYALRVEDLVAYQDA